MVRIPWRFVTEGAERCVISSIDEKKHAPSHNCVVGLLTRHSRVEALVTSVSCWRQAQTTARSANTALRCAAMGLFANRRRSKVKQEPTAGTAESVAPTKQRPEDAVSFEDFKAEVSAAGLADDWTERRLQLQFQAIDENGDGWVERKEFKKAMHNLNRLSAALDDVKPKEDLISRAVGKTLETYKGEKRRWMHDDHPIGDLWVIYGPLVLMAMLGQLKAVVEDKVVRTAKQVVAAALGSFDTIVLATVKAGNWRACWVSGLIATLLRNIPRCKEFTMFAVKGGPACDCEIQFIEIFMELLGAEVFAKAADRGTDLLWQWNVKRDGAGDCLVSLFQYKTVEDASADSLKEGFLADKDYARAPNLSRCAVVSAPVTDEAGEPIAAHLNKNVGDALESAKELAAMKGFAPARGDFAYNPAWQKAFIAYAEIG